MVEQLPEMLRMQRLRNGICHAHATVAPVHLNQERKARLEQSNINYPLE